MFKPFLIGLILTTSVGLGLVAIAARTSADEDAKTQGYVLRGGLVVDGTGAEARRADVAIEGDRIVAVGEFEARPGFREIDATGLVVAPGFIDLHSHSDVSILNPRTRSNLNYLSQGVTTVVTGNCGSGPVDVARYFRAIRKQGAGTNIIHLIPQGSVRREALGTAEAPATLVALEIMERLVERGMRAGAWGMSSGLIYVPSRYADTAELAELAKVVARYGGIYASHIRSEEDGLLDAIDEAIEVGRLSGAQVHISHLKANGRANWGMAGAACERIEKARAQGLKVTADQYPYVASSTSLGAMVVPHWARQGTDREFVRMASDPALGPRLRGEIVKELESREGGSSIRIARYPLKPDRVGRNLVEIARNEGTTPLAVVLDIQSHGGAQAISFGMSEDDVRFVMKRPYVATASDGSAHAPGGGDQPHPRAYGTFPRKIRYALDEHVLSLEAAIRSCSGLPAEILGMPDRGTLREGNYADVVVFDPMTFRDTATFDRPTQYARGLVYLFVNGAPVIAEGKSLNRLAGRVLTPQNSGPADLILKAGRVWTGDERNPRAEAIASRNGVIVFVGSAEGVERFRGPRTRVIDRPGDFAMPGLIDAHGHMTSLGESAVSLDLRDLKSPEAVAERVKQRMTEQPGDGWITGRNWDQSLWPGGAFPTAEVLDRVASDRPVWLRRVDGHAAWANSEAMRRAGVTKDSQAPADGQIMRDEQGNPTGVFIDGAMGLVGKAVPAPSDREVEHRILEAQRLCLEAGLTGVHDAGLDRQDEAAFRRLDRAGKLKIRVYGMAIPPEGDEVLFVRQRPLTRKPGQRFEVRAIKLFIDGAMGSRGALLFEPYSDDPENKGLQLINEDVLRETTETALRHGWQVCTHAIGDRGNALVLDAYAAALKAVPEAEDPRLRIEHAQVVRKSDVERFRELGLIASMQPAHASTDMRWADARLGVDSERVKGAYAWKWFEDAGVPLAFGSDFPVEIPSPFWGLYASVSRRNAEGEPTGGWHAEQILSLETAVRAYTAGSAHAAFEEGRLGVLSVGRLADLTVVDRDLFGASAEEIRQARVTATIIEGEVVYQPGDGH